MPQTPTSLEALRRETGNNLGGLYPTRATVVDGSTFTVPYVATFQPRGHLIRYRGETRSIYQATVVNNDWQMVVRDAFPGAMAGSDVAEVWNHRWHPDAITGWINTAISEMRGSVFTHLPSVMYISGRNEFEAPLPAGAGIVYSVEERLVHDWAVLVGSGGVSSWAPDGDERVGITLDTEDYVTNPPSVRVDVTQDLPNGLIHRAPIRKNISGMTHLEFWMKVQIPGGLGARRLELNLLSEAGVELFSVNLHDELVGVSGWTYMRIELEDAVASRLLNVDRVQLDMSGWFTGDVLWLSNIVALDERTVDWLRLENELWQIDPVRNVVRLRYRNDGLLTRLPEGYHRINIGGSPPDLVDDADETEVYRAFVVARAVELGYSAVSGGRESDVDQFRQQVALWHERAEMNRSIAFQARANARLIR